MTAATAALAAGPRVGEAYRRATRNARARGIVLAALGVAALGMASSTMATPVAFSFWIDEQGGAAATFETTAGVLWLATGVVTGISGIYQLWRGAETSWRRWLALILPFWIAAGIGTLLNGQAASMTNVFAGSLEYAFPIAMGAFAGMICERSGMFNIAIEGKFLVGACVASIAASITGSVIVGPIAAMLAGMGVGLLLAWLAIRYRVDQIISGTVVNIGALGLTNFLYLRILQRNTDLNTPPTISAIQIPVLSHIPVIGPILFSGTPYLYVAIITMFVLTYMLFRTRWGLRLRACGEYPEAAGTVGIDVIRIRYRAMILAGAIAGFAGSYLSLASAGSFQINMSAGKGFIALAAMIFGGWTPIGAFGAALVFGFADATQGLLSILGVDVPPQLLNSVPYVVTIIIVAGVVGRVRGPAASGRPYEQG